MILLCDEGGRCHVGMEVGSLDILLHMLVVPAVEISDSRRRMFLCVSVILAEKGYVVLGGIHCNSLSSAMARIALSLAMILASSLTHWWPLAMIL